MANQAKTHAFAGLIFKVADAHEREQVLSMRLAVYSVEWPDTPTNQVVDKLDEASYHLIALAERDYSIIAAARIVPAQHRPFDLEYYVPLTSILPSDRSPAEIGRFCIRRDNRRVQLPFVSLGLLKLALGVASREGITDFVLTALPGLRSLYRKAYFSFVGVAFEHPTWGHVDVMRLDIASLLQHLRDSDQPTPRLLLEPDPKHFILG